MAKCVLQKDGSSCDWMEGKEDGIVSGGVSEDGISNARRSSMSYETEIIEGIQLLLWKTKLFMMGYGWLGRRKGVFRERGSDGESA